MTEKKKPAGLAQQAGILCNDPSFQLYLDRRSRAKFGITPEALPDGTHNADDARDWLVAACKIQSRRELDANVEASRTFRQIRNRWQRWRARESAGGQRGQ